MTAYGCGGEFYLGQGMNQVRNEHFTSFACQFLMDAFLASTPAYPGGEEGQKKSQAKTMGSVHDGLHVWESILTRVTE
jgi:hypothetical protein